MIEEINEALENLENKDPESPLYSITFFSNGQGVIENSLGETIYSWDDEEEMMNIIDKILENTPEMSMDD